MLGANVTYEDLGSGKSPLSTLFNPRKTWIPHSLCDSLPSVAPQVPDNDVAARDRPFLPNFSLLQTLPNIFPFSEQLLYKTTTFTSLPYSTVSLGPKILSISCARSPRLERTDTVRYLRTQFQYPSTSTILCASRRPGNRVSPLPQTPQPTSTILCASTRPENRVSPLRQTSQPTYQTLNSPTARTSCLL